MLVDATGTTAATASSVYAVKFGVQGVRWVLGNDGMFDIKDPLEIQATDSSSNPYTALMQELYAWSGLQVGSVHAVARIRNITEDSGKGLTTTLLRSLFRKMSDVGQRPDAFFMTQRSYDQYEAHLEGLAISPPEATRMGFRGVPFVVTNSLSDVETIGL